VLDNLSPLLDNLVSSSGVIKENLLQNRIGVKVGEGLYQNNADSPNDRVARQREQLMKLIEMKMAECI